MVFIVLKTRPPYPDEFRREALQMLRAGRTPRELAEALGVSEQTLRDWRRQDEIDRRERDDGLTRRSGRSCAGCAARMSRSSTNETCSEEPQSSSRRTATR